MDQYNFNIIPQHDHRVPIRLFVVSPESPTRFISKHWHKGGELIYCEQGCYKVWLEGNYYELKPGDCLFIEPYKVHEVKQIENSCLYVLQISDYYLKYVHIRNNIGVNCNSLLLPNKDYSIIQKVLPLMMNHIRSNDEYGYLKLNSLLYDLMYHLAKNFSYHINEEEFLKSQKHFDMISDILSYIKNHAYDTILQQEVSEYFGYNPQYFARFFKKNLGITFFEYVNNLKVERARRNLIKSDLTILSISEEVGFSSPKSLNRAFKRVYDMTPSRYRELYQR